MDLEAAEEANVDKGVNDLDREVHSHVPSATMHRTPNTLFFTLPFDFTHKFPALFEALEAVNQSNGRTFANLCGARSYGIAMTTLEQVFLRLGLSHIIFPIVHAKA